MLMLVGIRAIVGRWLIVVQKGRQTAESPVLFKDRCPREVAPDPSPG